MKGLAFLFAQAHLPVRLSLSNPAPMSSVLLSSGDLTADRRAAYAQDLALSGDAAAAADLQEQALERAPGWAAGWYLLGNYREQAGDLAGAADAWRKVLELSPDDIFGAGLKLALTGQATVPAAPPAEYVTALFDGYSNRFDTALVENLGYNVPEQLWAMIAARCEGKPSFVRVMDLGCGTGLFGSRVRSSTSWLEGYDLSDGMLNEARRKGFYDHLASADIARPFDTGGRTEKAQLVAAADVYAYLGDLEPAISVAASLLATGGLFAFSLEAAGPGITWRLQPSLRYCHGEDYVRSALETAGFSEVEVRKAEIRKDRGEAIQGLLVVARLRASTTVQTAQRPDPETAKPVSTLQ